MAQAAAIGLMVGSQLFAAHSESEQLKDAARTDDENARLTELQGAFDSEDLRRRGRAQQGEAIAALGASGGSIEGQSARDLIFQNQLELEYSVLSRTYSAAGEAFALRQSATGKRKAARSAMFGGMLRAGAAALTGVSDMNNAAATREAGERLRNARLPGAQKLPIPAGLVPTDNPNPGPFPRGYFDY